MKRVFINQSLNYIGKKIKVAGWINSIRSHGKINFIDLRDKTGILQVFFEKDLKKEFNEEDVVEIVGTIQLRPKQNINPNLETGKIELRGEEILLLSKAKTLPFDLKNLNLSLPKLLDFRPLSLKNEKIKAIFRVEEVLIDAFRESLKKRGFFEFQAPTIVFSSTEGGAQLFEVNYYGKKAYLAQSPQLYKQILVSSFERVFTVCKAFRAEPSVTTRHLSEYISLDCEMGFIESWKDLLELCEEVIKEMVSKVAKECKKELSIFNVSLPNLKKRIPSLKLKEAQEIIFQRTGKDKRKNPDLDPEDEKEICNFAKEKWKSEFVFITHFPTEKRPFYTFEDPEDPNFTLSFDLLFRGLEIVTGGQRIHDYQMLISKMKRFGLDPKKFDFYLQAFKYGMPPEGGFAIGAERFVKQILNLENIREASLFPRDLERIDLRLSTLKSKKCQKD
jgi:nondiscriminating aspartyl-tRNA synthetase